MRNAERVGCDAGPIIALINRRDQFHRSCVTAAEDLRLPLYTVWPVIVEAYYVLVTVSALLYSILGFIIGALFSLFALLGVALGGFNKNGQGGALVGLVIGVGAVVFFPIFYGVIGAISGLIFSALYNLAAKATGGLELDID